MHRGWMENVVIARGWSEPYTRREAWVWLIEDAAWEDHDVPYKGKKILIKRGDVPTTMRDLMAKWRWSQGKVQRFLDDLEGAAMIVKKTDTGFCIISICNYDAYQNPKNLTDTQTDTQTDTKTDTQTDTSIKKENNLKKENKLPPTPRGGKREPALIENLPVQHKEPCRFESEFWPLCPRRENKKKAKEAYDKARLKDSQTNIIAGMRAYRRKYENDDRPADEKDKFYKWPQGWLNDERWRDFTESEQQDDDDEMPKNMTPEEHAKWCARRLGLWPIQ